jgi:hypothetical protein
MIVFLSQFAFSLVLFWLLARYIFRDYARSLPAEKLNALILAPHALRLLGLLAIVPEVVGEPLTKTSFASSVAYGDAIVAPLALLSVWLWLTRSGAAKVVTWIFSVVASLDLANAVFGALTLPVYNYGIGAFWIVLTYVVPLLIVTQAMIFGQLMAPGRELKGNWAGPEAAQTP